MTIKIHLPPPQEPTTPVRTIMAQELYEQGYIQGFQERFQEGREEVQKSVALNMLKEKMAISLIADVTELSITEVKALQKEERSC
ncbi:MAG: hypothetical protein AAGB12_13975 [Pseudomonadota bacterium]